MPRIFLSFLFCLIFAFGAFTQSSKTAEIRTIDRYVKQLNAYTKQFKGPHVVFADVSQTEKPKWKRFASDKALEKFRESSETYTIAYVWRKNGTIVTANFTMFSESGDWAHYVFHYFRADGSLAKIEADLRTFYGDISVQQDFYFDTSGRLLRKRTRYRDLKTNKPKKAPIDFFDDEVRIYKSVKKLPFARVGGK